MGDDSDAQLEQRVEQLEAANEQHREWLKQMLPDRRGVLKGLGAAALGGAAVGGATGGASGQSAAGQVGTESEPVDVEGAQGNFNSVNTHRVYSTETVDPDDGTAGINEAISGPNTHIRLFPGVYDGPQVNIGYDNVFITGPGTGFHGDAQGSTAIRVTEAASPVEYAEQVTGGGLSGITLDGNRANYASGPGIKLGGFCSGLRFQNIGIINTETHGIESPGDWNNWVEGVFMYEIGDGNQTADMVHINDTAGSPSHWKITNCDLAQSGDTIGNTRSAVRFPGSGSAFRVVNTETSGSERTFIAPSGTVMKNVRIVGVYDEHATTNFVDFPDGGHITIRNCRSYGGAASSQTSVASGDGIIIGDATDVEICYNRMDFDGDDYHIKSGAGSVSMTGNSGTRNINTFVHLNEYFQSNGVATRILGNQGTRMEVFSGGRLLFRDPDQSEALDVDSGSVGFFDNRIRDPKNSASSIDPTTETPSGSVEVSIGGTVHEIPYY